MYESDFDAYFCIEIFVKNIICSPKTYFVCKLSESYVSFPLRVSRILIKISYFLQWKIHPYLCQVHLEGWEFYSKRNK